MGEHEQPVRFEFAVDKSRSLVLRGESWLVRDNGQPERRWAQITYHESYMAEEIDRLRQQLAESRETNRRLNGRCQLAESALGEYRRMVALPPDGDGIRFVSGSFGRAMLAYHCDKLEQQVAKSRAALAECKHWKTVAASLQNIVDGDVRPMDEVIESLTAEQVDQVVENVCRILKPGAGGDRE